MDAEKVELIQEVIKLKAGDGKAFERIYELTNRSAWFTALKIVGNEEDAQDVIQESYMIMIDKVGSLENPAAFSKWFNMIVANKAKEVLRKNKKHLFADANEMLSEEEKKKYIETIEEERAEFNPGTLIEQLELKKQVMDLIDNLSDDKRTAVLLYYFNDLSIKQISEALDVNENTVKSRLFHAKKYLEKSIREIEEKRGKLLNATPASIIAWALKESVITTESSFVASGAAAETLAAVTTAAAMAGLSTGAVSATTATVVAGAGAASIVQKVAIGVATVAVLGSTATVFARVQRQRITAKQTQSIPLAEEISTVDNADVVFLVEESGTVTETTQEETAQPVTEQMSTSVEMINESQPAAETEQSATTRKPAQPRTTKAKNTTTKASNKTTALSTSTTTAAATATEKKSETSFSSNPVSETSTKKPESSSTATTATTSTSTRPTTTETVAQTATIVIDITKNGVHAETINLSLKEGSVFNKADALNAVENTGENYDTAFAEYSGDKLPLTAEAGKTYHITVDVE